MAGSADPSQTEANTEFNQAPAGTEKRGGKTDFRLNDDELALFTEIYDNVSPI